MTVCCNDCNHYFKQDGQCYRCADGPRPIPDPTVRDPDCAQDKGCPTGLYSAKFPYCRELCEGCRADSDNTILDDCECQGFKVRPRSIEDGPCPYYSATEPYGNTPRIDRRGPPAVTKRMAEIIVRGIETGNYAYWEVDNCSGAIQIGSESEARDLCISVGGYNRCRVLPARASLYITTFASATIEADHAAIHGNDLVLTGSGGTLRIPIVSRAAIEDARKMPAKNTWAVWSRPGEDDEDEDEPSVCEYKPPKAPPRTMTLEAFMRSRWNANAARIPINPPETPLNAFYPTIPYQCPWTINKHLSRGLICVR